MGAVVLGIGQRVEDGVVNSTHWKNSRRRERKSEQNDCLLAFIELTGIFYRAEIAAHSYLN